MVHFAQDSGSSFCQKNSVAGNEASVFTIGYFMIVILPCSVEDDEMVLEFDLGMLLFDICQNPIDLGSFFKWQNAYDVFLRGGPSFTHDCR